MRDEDFKKLTQDVQEEFLKNQNVKIGILGLTAITLRLLDFLNTFGMGGAVNGVFVDSTAPPTLIPFPCPVCRIRDLTTEAPDVLVVASDKDKESIIRTALPFIKGTPKMVVAGYSHYEFHDPILTEEAAQLLVPSFANGYRHTLVHIYQCLSNAARLKLEGVVVEFGMFKGGTTMLMARLIRRLKMPWKVIGFDSFDGFPPRRSPLDMYDHPGCVFTNLLAVQNYLANENVEIVAGDIVQTVGRLTSEKMVLAFIDTDNFTPAESALDVIQDRIQIGGAIVFDHYTGENRFRYTLGERMAASRLESDFRFFNLHGTGVFLRQR